MWGVGDPASAPQTVALLLILRPERIAAGIITDPAGVRSVCSRIPSDGHGRSDPAGEGTSAGVVPDPAGVPLLIVQPAALLVAFLLIELAEVIIRSG